MPPEPPLKEEGEAVIPDGTYLSRDQEVVAQVNHELGQRLRARFVALFADAGAELAFAMSLESGRISDLRRDVERGRVSHARALEICAIAATCGIFTGAAIALLENS